ncbi:MAG: sigma-70 family RNA polymerase sigma factor [Pseudomonadota bacterium]
MTTRDDIESYLARMALRERAAFDLLYSATSAKLFGVCLRILNDRQQAEEALQDAYLRIWERADRYRANGLSPMTWLITVTRNLAIDRLRARKAAAGGAGATVGEDVLDRIADGGPTPEQAALASSEGEKLRACLGELPADRAEAVARAYMIGDTYQELATRFDVPLNTMRTWLRRALMSLKECLTR